MHKPTLHTGHQVLGLEKQTQHLFCDIFSMKCRPSVLSFSAATHSSFQDFLQSQDFQYFQIVYHSSLDKLWKINIWLRIDNLVYFECCTFEDINCVDKIWPIPLFPTDANVVIADKRFQCVYTSHKFIIKIQFGCWMCRYSLTSGDQCLTVVKGRDPWTFEITKIIKVNQSFEWCLFLGVSIPSYLFLDLFLISWHKLSLLHETQVFRKYWSRKEMKTSYSKRVPCSPVINFGNTIQNWMSRKIF